MRPDFPFFVYRALLNFVQQCIFLGDVLTYVLLSTYFDILI